MSLSSDAKLFTQRVREAPISGNIDNPEGGFDALLQVLVIKNPSPGEKMHQNCLLCKKDFLWFLYVFLPSPEFQKFGSLCDELTL